MANSMTGYGRGEYESGGLKAVVEMKSVNHRYFEVNVKNSSRIFRIDETIKRALKKRFSRGYFDVTVSLDRSNSENQNISVVVNEELLEGYLKVASALAEKHGVKYPPTFDALLGVKDIITVECDETDSNDWDPLIKEALNQAAGLLSEARKTEGAHTSEIVANRLNNINKLVDQIKDFHETSSSARFEKLTERIQKLVSEVSIDETRLAQEAAILADKSQIAEELERLGSHLAQAVKLVSGFEGPIGRKLEFFTQEINREVNTIGAKTTSADATNLVVEIKSELEKIREQSQNLE